MRHRSIVLAAASLAIVATGCGGSSSTTDTATTTAPTPSSSAPPTADAPTSDAPKTTIAPSTTTVDVTPAAAPVTFTAEIWADNWFSLTVNGEPVGEDSVPITTERSFNAETFTFTATYPLTIALVSKDFVENESGLEYIGTDRQQMGDGGLIAQFTDTSTGAVVAVTDASWRGLVVFSAPLNTECETSSDPTTECTHETLAEPDGWTSADFDDSGWDTATEYTAEAVGAKDGYDTIAWSPDAALIWSGSLTVDNTILWRHTVPAPSSRPSARVGATQDV